MRLTHAARAVLPVERMSTGRSVLVVDGDRAHEVFDVLGIADGVARVRSPYLFEIGEELTVRIEQDGTVTEAVARVRAHVGPPDAQVTELEISDR